MPTSEDRGFHPTKVTSTRHVVPADFHEFPDGTLIELIANASSPTGLSFVVFENGGPDIRDSYIHGEEVFEPALPTSRWARSLELPHGFGPKLPYQELFANVAAAINCFVDVDHVSLGQLAAFVLATWLPGLGSTAPFVLIVGPVGSGKTTLLKVLSCMCRRSLMIAGATARPTRITDVTPPYVVIRRDGTRQKFLPTDAPEPHRSRTNFL